MADQAFSHDQNPNASGRNTRTPKGVYAPERPTHTPHDAWPLQPFYLVKFVSVALPEPHLKALHDQAVRVRCGSWRGLELRLITQVGLASGNGGRQRTP